MANYYGTSASETIDPLNPADDYIFGDAGNDILYGWSGNDTIDGWKGHDSLYGEAGDDTLLGYSGNDYLSGGEGSDRLVGESGYDTLNGGAGADTFVFNSPWEGIDTIQDFKYQEGDTIEVSSAGFGIGADEYEAFTFDSSTNSLFFEDTQLATLQPNSGFVPSLDITIV
jgi:Ca2+-binding RTX toxin-like protein